MKHIILPSLVHTCLISGMPLRKDQFVLKLKSPTLVIEYSQDDVRYFMSDMTLNSNLIISSQEQVYFFSSKSGLHFLCIVTCMHVVGND